MDYKKLLISSPTKELFELYLENNVIDPDAVGFIEEPREIWALGEYYPCPYSKDELDEIFLNIDDDIQDQADALLDFIEEIKAGVSEEYNNLEKIENKIKENKSSIDLEIQDRKEAIEALDVDAIGESGKYIYQVSETDGKISASYKQAEAKEIKNESEKTLIASANNVLEALDALCDVATKLSITAADKSVVVDQKASGTTIKVNIKEGEEVLTLDAENGLFTNISINKLDTTSGENILEEYELVSTNGTRLGQTIKIYKDRTLEDVEFTEEGEHGEDGQFLKFTYILEDGNYKVVYVDMSELIHESEFGDGLQVKDHVVSAKRDTNSEDFLSISEDGIKVSGIQTAINTAKNEVLSNLDAEIERATEAESTLTTNLQAEVTRATDAESTLQDNIDATDAKVSALETKMGDTSVSTLISNAINALDSNATSTDGTNVQVKVTQTDGKISAVNITTDKTAPLASPAFTGTPTAPTATAGTNSTQIATTAFVKTAVNNAIDNLIDGASTAMDTFAEIEQAFKDNDEVIEALNEAITTKADKSTTVTNVAYGSKKLTKTINGTTTDVVSASTIVTDGGGLTAHQSVTDNNPTLAWGTKSKVATIGDTDINVTMPANPVSSTTVTGSGLTADTIILGNGSSTVKTSNKTITTSVGSDDTTIPTSKAVSDFVEGKADKATTLSGYGITDAVTTNTTQTISGQKTFTKYPIVDLSETDNTDPGSLQTVLLLKSKSQGLTYNTPIISVLGSRSTANAYNHDIRLGSTTGSTWISSGESGATLSKAIQMDNLENVYITSDGSIQFYSGVSNDSTTYYNSATINKDGISATKITKTGGTSSLFLKADGSVDSNTYLTTTSADNTYVKKSGDTMSGNLFFNKIEALFGNPEDSLKVYSRKSLSLEALDGSIILSGEDNIDIKSQNSVVFINDYCEIDPFGLISVPHLKILNNDNGISAFIDNKGNASFNREVTKTTTSGALSFNATIKVYNYIVTMNGNVSSCTFTNVSSMSIGNDYTVIFYGNGTQRTVNIACSGIYKTPTGEDLTLTVPANGYVEVNYLYDGTNIWVRGV